MQALLNANMSPEAMDTSLGNMETEINNRVSTLHDSVADVSKGKNLQPLADFYKFVAEQET